MHKRFSHWRNMLTQSIPRLVASRLLTEKRLLKTLQDPRAYSMLRWRSFLDNCFLPDVFYDIGANDPFSPEGQQTVFKPLMPVTCFYLFEAMAKHEAALIRSKEPYALALLGETEGMEKTFYESRAYAPGTGDSYYRERTSAYDASDIIETKHKVRCLDNLVKERGWPLPDFIKLDTQGSELDILRGAGECLTHARGLQIECNIRNYNEGAPLLHDTLSFVQDAGFRLYDIAQMHFTRRTELLQIDMLLIRSELFESGD